MQYHQIIHSFLIHKFSESSRTQTTTDLAPCELLNKRKLKSRLDLIRPDVNAKVTQKHEKQVMSEQHKARSFEEHDCVIIRNYSYGPKWLKGVVLSVDGLLRYAVELVLENC